MFEDIPYHNPVVRDLAWCISSPALIQRSDTGMHWPTSEWFSKTGTAFHETLRHLDSRPESLQAFIRGRKDHRLGFYFEALWRFWLSNNDRYRLLHANIPVRGGGRTLGEFDLLVKDLETGRTLHWELAVKFYLGVNETVLPANWWGPAQRDRLDLKTRRLLEHQGKLSHQPESRDLLKTLDLRVDETWLIFKGRLFYPLHQIAEAPDVASPEHLRGFWTRLRALEKLPDSLWIPLERHQWLAPLADIEAVECLDNRRLADYWQGKALSHPACIARIENGHETNRGFIVPDSWPSKNA